MGVVKTHLSFIFLPVMSVEGAAKNESRRRRNSILDLGAFKLSK